MWFMGKNLRLESINQKEYACILNPVYYWNTRLYAFCWVVFASITIIVAVTWLA